MIPQVLSVIILISLTLFYLFYLKPFKAINRFSRQFTNSGYKVLTLPFHPLKFPIFQTMLTDSQSGDPFKTYKTKFVQYDMIVSNVLATPALCFLSPQARKQFVKHQIDYSYEKNPIITKLQSRIFGKGLVFSEGNEWKRKRRLISTFFTYQFINSKIPDMLRICQSSLDQIQNQSHKINKQLPQNQFKFQLFPVASRMFSNIVLSIFLGNQSLQQEIDGKKLYLFVINLITDCAVRMNQTLPLVLGPKFLDFGLTAVDRDLKRRLNIFNKWADNYVGKIIQKTAQNQKPNNLLQLIYLSKQKDNQRIYDKKELIDELKVFFFAGTDTTSHFLEFMIYLTVKTEKVYQKVKEQIQSYNQEINSIESLKKLKLIEGIQKQTVRQCGPLPINFPRVVMKDILINGVPVMKGTSIQYNSISTHYNPQIYPQPFQFNPNRWLEREKQFDAAQLTGFGMGPRSCIGQHLANIQSKIAFFCFFKRYQEVKVPKQVPFRWKFMCQAQNLQVTVTKRV